MRLLSGIVSGFAFVATFLFVYWVPFSVLMPDRSSGAVPLIGSLTAAGLAAGFVWRALATAERGFFGAIAIGAAVVGTIGFIGGFFGPLIFAPEANQGPLLGLFITGPGGFLVGGIGGAVYWLINRRA